MGDFQWTKGQLAYLDDPVYGLIKVAVVGRTRLGAVAVRVTARRYPRIHDRDESVRTGRILAANPRHVVPRSAVYVSRQHCGQVRIRAHVEKGVRELPWIDGASCLPMGGKFFLGS